MTDHSDRGSATVIVVALLAALAVVAGAVLAAAAGRVAVLRAQGAADAAAVSGAAASVGLVPGAPCTVAARVVHANGADVVACSDAGAFVRVSTAVGAGPFRFGASAVAGPEPTPHDDPRGSVQVGIPDTVCMVCLSARRSSMSRSTRTRPRPRADSTIDQGVTCQARRSS